MLTTTLNKIKEYDPYKIGWDELISSFPEDQNYDAQISFKYILENTGLKYALWTLGTLDSEIAVKTSAKLAIEFIAAVPTIIKNVHNGSTFAGVYAEEAFNEMKAKIFGETKEYERNIDRLIESCIFETTKKVKTAYSELYKHSNDESYYYIYNLDDARASACGAYALLHTSEILENDTSALDATSLAFDAAVSARAAVAFSKNMLFDPYIKPSKKTDEAIRDAAIAGAKQVETERQKEVFIKICG